jgi:hypothetical protein
MCLLKRTCVSTNRKTSERQLFRFSQVNTVVLFHNFVRRLLRCSLESDGTTPGRTAKCSINRHADKIRPKVRGDPISARNRNLRQGVQGAAKRAGAVSTQEVPSYNTAWMRLLQKAAAEHATESQT